jgi:hypothetical protein
MTRPEAPSSGVAFAVGVLFGAVVAALILAALGRFPA